MTGVMLLSADNYYADEEGKVDWGPEADKLWLRRYITDEVVLIGHNTWSTIEHLDKLLKLATWTFTDAKNATINFGGFNTWKKFPPDLFIVHRTYENLNGGFKLPRDFFDDYREVKTYRYQTYEEILYEKK